MKLAPDILYASPFSLRRGAGGAGGSPATPASRRDTPSKLRLPVMCPGVLPEPFHHLLQPPFVKATALALTLSGPRAAAQATGSASQLSSARCRQISSFVVPGDPFAQQEGL